MYSRLVVKMTEVIYIPLSDDEISQLDCFVKAVIGYSQERGDVVMVSSNKNFE